MTGMEMALENWMDSPDQKNPGNEWPKHIIQGIIKMQIWELIPTCIIARNVTIRHCK
jgi:hypothetical protein